MQMFPRSEIGVGDNAESAIDNQALTTYVHIGQAVHFSTSPGHFSQVDLCYKKHNY